MFLKAYFAKFLSAFSSRNQLRPQLFELDAVDDEVRASVLRRPDRERDRRQEVAVVASRVGGARHSAAKEEVSAA